MRYRMFKLSRMLKKPASGRIQSPFATTCFQKLHT